MKTKIKKTRKSTKAARIDNNINMATGECVAGCCDGDTSGTGGSKTKYLVPVKGRYINRKTGEPFNTVRASWAGAGLVTFASHTGQEDDLKYDSHSVVTDFLTDLMHWCHFNSIDFQAALASATNTHYAVEVEQEGGHPLAAAQPGNPAEHLVMVADTEGNFGFRQVDRDIREHPKVVKVHSVLCTPGNPVAELLDLLGHDIFTDDADYQDRVKRIHELTDGIKAGLPDA
jgi:hypothetical protein